MTRDHGLGHSPASGPGATPIPENRCAPKARILHPRLELVAGLLLPAAPAERPHVRDRAISRARPRPTPRHPRGLGRWNHDSRVTHPRRFVERDRIVGRVHRVSPQPIRLRPQATVPCCRRCDGGVLAMGCGGIQPRETDCVGRAWCGRGLRDRHPATTRPTARSLPLGARAPGRHGGTSTPSRSHSPRTSSARLVDRTAPGATRPWRRQRATASRPLAGPRPARTLTTSPRDTSSCTSDGPLTSCRDRAPAAVTVAREPTAASSQPKGCAPTPCGVRSVA